MTRKDFELVAGVLRHFRDEVSPSDQTDVLDVLCNRFAEALTNTNANFNRLRFLRACGVEAA